MDFFKAYGLHESWQVTCEILEKMAGATRLELATSGVTGRRSNQLNYAPVED
jgi:hypothetical protein